MDTKTKYLKIACNLATALVILWFIIFILPQLMSYFMPFVVGLILAVIANPIVKFLEKHIKINRKWGSMITIIAVIGFIVLIIYGAVTLLGQGIVAFMDYMPTMTTNAGHEFSKAMNQLQTLLDRLPFTKDVDFSELIATVEKYAANALTGTGSSPINAIGGVAKSLPDILVSVIVGLMATYFFVADKDRLITGIENHLPKTFIQKIEHIYQQLVTVVGGYFKAQFKIMGVIYVIVFIGLLLLHVRFAWIIAFGIAFLDMLPVFGTGTVLCPWAVIKLFSGNYYIAAGMIILYIVTLVVHQLVQPKLIGDSVGLDPFAALFFMFIGYKVSSVVGMILAIPIGMILINLYKAGAFDTVVWCLKEAISDFNSFRRVDEKK